MTDKNIHFLIMGDYKNFIKEKGLGVNVINKLIKEYNLDPCDPNSFIVEIDKLKIDLKKNYNSETVRRKENFC